MHFVPISVRSRSKRPLALAAILACALGRSSAQQEVAQVEVEVPAAARFILKFTLPIPDGIWPDGGLLPLKVVLPGGGPVADTQMESVVRFAAATGTVGAVKVAECLARVTKDPSWVPGQRVRYSVVLSPGGTQPIHTPGLAALISGPTSVGAGVQGLLGSDDNIVVLAKDPLGNQYYSLPLRGADGKKIERDGAYEVTECFHEIMRPASGAPPAGGYPHMMSVHSYLSTRALTNNLSLDLRVTNGTDGADPTTTADDILGKIYFESLTLLVIQDAALDWRAQTQFVDPFGIQAGYVPNTIVFRGKTYSEFPLVSALPPVGEVQPCHEMPAKGQFHRRLIVSPASGMSNAREILDGQGQGFVVDGQNSSGTRFWSWFNPDTAFYFPQNSKLADLSFTNVNYGGLPDLRAVLTGRYTALRDTLANNTPGTGTDGVILPGYHTGAPGQMGAFRPLGLTIGYEHGGQGIQFLDGERAIAATSLDGFRYLQLLHRMHSERQFNVMWGGDGEPSYQDKFLFDSPGCTTCPTGPNGVPSQAAFSFYMDDGPSDPRYLGVPTWTQNQYVIANGKRPPYDGYGFWEYNVPCTYCPTNLNAYMPHWSSHLIRYDGFPLAVAYISNDPLAKDDVLAQAEMARMTFTEYPNPAYITGSSLYSLTQAANHCGTYAGRQQGWMIDAGAGAFALEGPAWRARTKVWFDRAANMLSTALGTVVDPSFINAATGLPYTYGVLGSTINDQFNFPTDASGAQIYKGVQSWEDMILLNGVRGIQQAVLPSGDANVTPMRTLTKRSMLELICPTFWNEAGHTVWGKVELSYIATPCDFFNCDPSWTTCPPGTNPLPVQPNGNEAGHYFGTALAQGYLASTDNLFLQKALDFTSWGSTCTTTCPTDIELALEASMDPADPGRWAFDSNLHQLLAQVQ